MVKSLPIVLGLLVSATLHGAACAPPPSRSRIIADPGLDSLTFGCGEWGPRAPRASRVVVDLRLHSGERNRVASDAEVARIEAMGGLVLHRFRVALLRAELDTGDVRALSTGPGAMAAYAYGVGDTSSHAFDAQVYYRRPTTIEDRDALTRLGARTLAQARPHIMYARLTDAIVPSVESLPGVDFVRARAIGCAMTR